LVLNPQSFDAGKAAKPEPSRARSGALQPPDPRPAGPPAQPPSNGRRFLRLGNLLFLSLLLSGIIPLAISTLISLDQGRALHLDRERRFLIQSADAMADRLGLSLEGLGAGLSQHGQALLAFAADEDVGSWLGSSSGAAYLRAFQESRPNVLVVAALDARTGEGPSLGSALPGEARRALDEVYQAVRTGGAERAYRIVRDSSSSAPLVVAGSAAKRGSVSIVVAAVERLEMPQESFAVLITDAAGDVLWADSYGAQLRPSLEAQRALSGIKPDLLSSTTPLDVEVGNETRQIQMTWAPIPSTGWFVVALQNSLALQATIQRMFENAVLPSLVLIALAFGFAVFVARFLGKPLARLAETTRQVAAGDFSQRIESRDLSLEMADLATNFNQMSGHVERYVEELKLAALANRELFLGSIRAFAAAIDAKDPYTRGHSERVAAVSRAVATHLGYDEDFQQRVWLAALLHDVGKIGVDDRVLKKGGLLSPEEYDQMKAHTVIGAEIIGRIDQLKEIVPAIRWHHEAWNGRGYPDGLKGEQIPLIARIVSVADTFDAVTTNRPYQQAYTPEFAVDTITKLAGNRFDAKVVTAFLSAFQAGQVESAIQRAPRQRQEADPAVELAARV
jgi:putative nucleotidyltransferase with HDIG domain